MGCNTQALHKLLDTHMQVVLPAQDKDRSHQKTHRCNQPVHQDQSRSFRRLDVPELILPTVEQLPLVAHNEQSEHLQRCTHNHSVLRERQHRSDQ